MNSNQDKQKITPAVHGDELDVLEVLYWIEKKNSDKSLLSDSQRSTLLSSGRVEEQITENISKEEAVKKSYRIIQAVLKNLDNHKDRIYSDSAWGGFDEGGKKFAREELFKKIYGSPSKDVGYAIFLSMMGEG